MIPFLKTRLLAYTSSSWISVCVYIYVQICVYIWSCNKRTQST